MLNFVANEQLFCPTNTMKGVSIGLFKIIQSTVNVPKYVASFSVFNVLIYGENDEHQVLFDSSSPIFIPTKSDIELNISDQMKSSGNGKKSVITNRTGVLVTVVSCAATAVKYASFSMGGLLALTAYVGWDVSSLFVSRYVRNRIAAKSVTYRKYVTDSAIYFARNVLTTLQHCCDVKYQVSFIERLNKNYKSNYLSSSDSSRCLDYKLKNNNSSPSEKLDILQVYLSSMSPTNSALYRNNGKKLFVCIVELTYNVKFELLPIIKTN